MNDMKLIMEGWRDYSKKCTTPTILLSDNPQRIFNDPVDQLLFEHAMGEKKIEDVALILEKYIDFQYQSILEEGIIDDIKKGAGEVKRAAKEQLFKFVYGTAGMLIRLLNTVMEKMISPIQKLINSIKSKAGEYLKSKEEQSKIIKVLMSVARKVKQVIAPIKAGMEKIGKFAYGESTRFPAFKGCMLAVACAVALLALTCGGLFAGALAFAPFYAGKKIAFAAGMKGVKSGLGAAKTSLAAKAAAGVEAAGEVLNEIITEVEEIASLSVEIWAVTKAFIIQAIQTAPDPANITTFSDIVVDASDVTGTGVGDASAELINWTAEDAAMNDAFNVLQDMDMDQFHPSNITAEDYALLSDEVKKIMGVAIKMATEHCENDPTACAGRDILMDNIQLVVNSSEVASETIDVMSQATESVTDLAMGATETSTTLSQAFATISDHESIDIISQAAKDAVAKMPPLDPDKVAELAQEMGLDDPKQPAQWMQALVTGDKEQIAKMAQDLGLADEGTKRMGAKKLQKMLLRIGLEDSSAKEIAGGLVKAMTKRVAPSMADALNEMVQKEVAHFMIMKEIKAI